MGIKENLEAVKSEFKADEKLFESAFRIERLIKKYKFVLIGLLVALVGGFAYMQVQAKMQASRALKASEIYTQLLRSPNNQALIDALGKNAPELQALFLLSQAIKNSDATELKAMSESKDKFIADFALYELASLRKDDAALGAVRGSFGDLAKIQRAYLLFGQKRYKEAHEILESIDPASPLREVAKVYLHYRGGDK